MPDYCSAMFASFLLRFYWQLDSSDQPGLIGYQVVKQAGLALGWAEVREERRAEACRLAVTSHGQHRQRRGPRAIELPWQASKQLVQFQLRISSCSSASPVTTDLSGVVWCGVPVIVKCGRAGQCVGNCVDSLTSWLPGSKGTAGRGGHHTVGGQH